MNNNGEYLVTVRKRLGLTKKKAADKIGCTAKTYAKYEREGLDYIPFIAAICDMGAERVDSERIVTIHFKDHEPLVIRQVINR